MVHAGVVVLALAAAAMAKPAQHVAAPTFTVPKSYEAEAIISMPYADISEPVHIWFDGVNNKSRIEYYEGMDTYIYRPDAYQYGALYQIVPEITTMSCVENNGTSDSPTTPQGLLPDLSTFQLSAETEYVRGIECNLWTYSFADGDKVNTYQFYVSTVTNAPILFHFLGYDALFGSHYDEYTINYLSFMPNPTFDSSIFNKPANMTCGAFPGPGMYGSHHERSVVAEMNNIPKFHADCHKHFDAFVNKYGKQYEHAAEHTFRKSIFVHHLRFVDSVNRREQSYNVDMNHMGDRTTEEFARMRGVRSSRPREQAKFVPADMTGVPTSFDWRDYGAVAPVKDQGICGSCWSFGSAESIEGAWFLKRQKEQNVTFMEPMSQQALMDCSWAHGNNACDGGEAFRAFDWVLENGYIPTQASYGVYKMADGMCHSDKAIKGAVLKSYVNVTSGNQSALIQNLMQGPVSVAIDAAHKEFVFYAEGVYYNPACGNTTDALDHEVLAIGWGIESNQKYFLIKNSWSDHWGDLGFVKMSMKDNNCGVATDPTRPVV